MGEEELGRGSGAVVKRGTWQGTPVACKLGRAGLSPHRRPHPSHLFLKVACKLWSAELFSDGDARG